MAKLHVLSDGCKKLRRFPVLSVVRGHLSICVCGILPDYVTEPDLSHVLLPPRFISAYFANNPWLWL